MRIVFALQWLGCIFRSESLASAQYRDATDHASKPAANFEGPIADVRHGNRKEMSKVLIRVHNNSHNQQNSQRQVLIRRDEIHANGDIRPLDEARSLLEEANVPVGSRELKKSGHIHKSSPPRPGGVAQPRGQNVVFTPADLNSTPKSNSTNTDTDGSAANSTPDGMAAGTTTANSSATNNDSNTTTAGNESTNAPEQPVNATESDSNVTDTAIDFNSSSFNSSGKRSWTTGPMLNIEYQKREATILPIKSCEQLGWKLGEMIALTQGRRSECCFEIIGFGSLIIAPRPNLFFDTGTAIHEVTTVSDHKNGSGLPSKAPMEIWNDIIKGGRDDGKIGVHNAFAHTLGSQGNATEEEVAITKSVIIPRIDPYGRPFIIDPVTGQGVGINVNQPRTEDKAKEWQRSRVDEQQTRGSWWNYFKGLVGNFSGLNWSMGNYSIGPLGFGNWTLPSLPRYIRSNVTTNNTEQEKVQQNSTEADEQAAEEAARPSEPTQQPQGKERREVVPAPLKRRKTTIPPLWVAPEKPTAPPSGVPEGRSGKPLKRPNDVGPYHAVKDELEDADDYYDDSEPKYNAPPVQKDDV